MKNFVLALALALGFSAPLKAGDDKKQHTYEGAITGVVCAACKEHVTAALTKKLPGFVSVSIKNTDSPESKKLTVVATNPDVTKESVTEALGTYAKNYQVLSLEKKE
jgi:copper chaperone CopZ